MKVWIPSGSQTDRHYHVDENCYNYPPDTRAVHIETAQHWWDPCSICVDDDDPHHRGPQKRDCPICGELTGDIPTHVIKEHSSDNSPVSGASR